MKNFGIKIIKYSILFMILTSFPLILYIIFGPKDGNPIGLGLLSFSGISLGQTGLLVGIICILIDLFNENEKTKLLK